MIVASVGVEIARQAQASHIAGCSSSCSSCCWLVVRIGIAIAVSIVLLLRLRLLLLWNSWFMVWRRLLLRQRLLLGRDKMRLEMNA